MRLRRMDGGKLKRVFRDDGRVVDPEAFKSRKYSVSFNLSLVFLVLFAIADAVGGIVAAIYRETLVLICTVIILVLLLSVFVVLPLSVLKRRRLQRELPLWLEDAFPATATAREIDRFYVRLHTLIRLEICFEKDGKQYAVQSAYNEGFCRYAGKTLDVLYSPKYDKTIIVRVRGERGE